MGLILDPEEIGGKLLALEIRRDSVIVMDINRKYPHEVPSEDSEHIYGRRGRSEHIFCYQEGEIEMSKEALLEIVTFLDDPKNRERVFGPYPKLAGRSYHA